jgi:hypothetical protein
VIKSNPTPCTNWVLKLSARHPDDLSPADRIALHEHLALCRTCTEVYASYQTMEAGIRSLIRSNTTFVPQYQLPRRERKSTPLSGFSLPAFITLVLSALSSLLMKVSWSRFYQELYTWVLLALAHVPQRVSYLSSNSHHTYAIQSGSGFILWQQKREYQYDLVPTAPLRWSGMCYIGTGVAYASALEFCRNSARA